MFLLSVVLYNIQIISTGGFVTNDKQLAKQLIQNGLRVLLTGKCNFSCFFCHNEGLTPNSTNDTEVDVSSIIDFVKYGVRDLTLSGGEPLLVFEKIINILDTLIQEIDSSTLKELEITIVTNGRLLSEDRINLLADYKIKFSGIRLNVSIHSPDPKIYDSVTRTVNQHATVIQNIQMAIKSDIEVRLNYVLLRDFNSDSDSIKEIIDYSSLLGVKRIKIIEFLVTDLNREFYSSFSRLDPVMYNHRFLASVIETRSKRKTSYTFPHKNLTVDFTRCTCALGCTDCIASRELEIGPGYTVIGCIAKEPVIYPHNSKPIEIALIAARQLNSMVHIYGNYSPSLVAEPKSIAGKGVFAILPGKESAILKDQAKVVTFKKFTKTNLMHRSELLNSSEYFFQLVESDEETHSRIICFQKRSENTDTIAWQEIEYLDPIYDFSRTKASVNRKKIQAMGYIPLKHSMISENTILLTDKNVQKLPVFLRYQEDVTTDTLKIFLEVLRVENKPWPDNEPLSTALRVAEEFSLKLIPLRTPSEIALDRLTELIRKHIPSKKNENLKYIYPVVFNALLIYHMLSKDELPNTSDEELFLTATNNSPASQHSKNDSKPENQVMRYIIEDALILEKYNFQKVILSYRANTLDSSILEYITEECLKVSRSDFNFKQTCVLALPGWYLLADYVKALDPSRIVPEKPDFGVEYKN